MSNESKPGLLSKEDLKKFVLDYITRDVFTNQQISLGCEISMVFMPLAFGVLKDWTKEEINNIGCIYARFSDGTYPRSVNGNPIFMTCSFMHKDDWARAVTAIQKAQDAVQDIDV